MDGKCWTAQLMQAFQGLWNSEIFEQAVRSGGAISMNDFSADLRRRVQGVWIEAKSVDPRGNSNKLATYQAWFATPFACNARQTYIPLPWYLLLDLPKQVMRNVSRFWLRAQDGRMEPLYVTGVLAVRLKMKHAVFFTALMNKFVLCAAKPLASSLRACTAKRMWQPFCSSSIQPFRMSKDKDAYLLNKTSHACGKQGISGPGGGGTWLLKCFQQKCNILGTLGIHFRDNLQINLRMLQAQLGSDPRYPTSLEQCPHIISCSCFFMMSVAKRSFVTRQARPAGYNPRQGFKRAVFEAFPNT
eukprot:1159185-Pelagomonas_calceolata.AAC.16